MGYRRSWLGILREFAGWWGPRHSKRKEPRRAKARLYTGITKHYDGTVTATDEAATLRAWSGAADLAADAADGSNQGAKMPTRFQRFPPQNFPHSR